MNHHMFFCLRYLEDGVGEELEMRGDAVVPFPLKESERFLWCGDSFEVQWSHWDITENSMIACLECVECCDRSDFLNRLSVYLRNGLYVSGGQEKEIERLNLPEEITRHL